VKKQVTHLYGVKIQVNNVLKCNSLPTASYLHQIDDKMAFVTHFYMCTHPHVRYLFGFTSCVRVFEHKSRLKPAKRGAGKRDEHAYLCKKQVQKHYVHKTLFGPI